MVSGATSWGRSCSCTSGRAWIGSAAAAAAATGRWGSGDDEVKAVMALVGVGTSVAFM